MVRMQKVIKAIYSEGVFKPIEKVNLSEGEKVEIEIKEQEVKKVISLRGIWRGIQINEENIEKAKYIWDKEVEKQINILEEETNS